MTTFLHVLAVTFFIAALLFVAVMATAIVDVATACEDQDELLLTRKIEDRVDHVDGGNA